jgi:hypothetical protein
MLFKRAEGLCKHSRSKEICSVSSSLPNFLNKEKRLKSQQQGSIFTHRGLYFANSSCKINMFHTIHKKYTETVTYKYKHW